ncbi:MAG TPA: sigma-70 family RNA polymerase sigma factor [Armatimonadota bacterium]|nr:sigma-70 family RNA polymerase sigma factor [Armatimonadota bacterium]
MARLVIDDSELMLRVRSGDHAAFGVLVDRHKQRVLNVVYRYLGPGADAEDIAQEVFIRVYGARRSYVASAKFTTWLYTICRNTCLKEQARRKTRRALEGIPMGGTDHSAEVAADAQTLSPLEAVLLDEHAIVAKRAIDSLPEAQRMALILRKYEGSTYEEIAEAMHCSVRAVKSLLYRARVTLRRELAEYLELGEPSE